MRAVSLGVVLFAFWLALSGHYTFRLISFGLICTVLCVYVAVRMRALDEESHPVHLLGGAVTYFPWLIWEIMKASWSVVRIIVDPKLPISPTMTVVEASQRTSIGINVYANSITLTPGTITTGVSGNRLTVHAIQREGADDLEAGGMDARVKQFEGEA
jgi:multicomponent Na+:H+ antiporter subunit E